MDLRDFILFGSRAARRNITGARWPRDQEVERERERERKKERERESVDLSGINVIEMPVGPTLGIMSIGHTIYGA